MHAGFMICRIDLSWFGKYYRHFQKLSEKESVFYWRSSHWSIICQCFHRYKGTFHIDVDMDKDPDETVTCRRWPNGQRCSSDRRRSSTSWSDTGSVRRAVGVACCNRGRSTAIDSCRDRRWCGCTGGRWRPDGRRLDAARKSWESVRKTADWVCPNDSWMASSSDSLMIFAPISFQLGSLTVRFGSSRALMTSRCCRFAIGRPGRLCRSVFSERCRHDESLSRPSSTSSSRSFPTCRDTCSAVPCCPQPPAITDRESPVHNSSLPIFCSCAFFSFSSHFWRKLCQTSRKYLALPPWSSVFLGRAYLVSFNSKW